MRVARRLQMPPPKQKTNRADFAGGLRPRLQHLSRLIQIFLALFRILCRKQCTRLVFVAGIAADRRQLHPGQRRRSWPAQAA